MGRRLVVQSALCTSFSLERNAALHYVPVQAVGRKLPFAPIASKEASAVCLGFGSNYESPAYGQLTQHHKILSSASPISGSSYFPVQKEQFPSYRRDAECAKSAQNNVQHVLCDLCASAVQSKGGSTCRKNWSPMPAARSRLRTTQIGRVALGIAPPAIG